MVWDAQGMRLCSRHVSSFATAGEWLSMCIAPGGQSMHGCLAAELLHDCLSRDFQLACRECC